MTQTFAFCKQTVTKTGAVKTGKTYQIKTRDDNSVRLRDINILREVGFGLSPIDEEQAKSLPENRDISGAGKTSPSMIIKQGDKFVCVPYNEEYKPVTVSNGEMKDSVFSVKDFMANHTKRVGRAEKGKEAPLVPDPIATYDRRVFIAIGGRIKMHVASQARSQSNKPLTIDFTGVKGVTPEDIEDVQLFCDMNEFEDIYIVQDPK